MKVEPSALRRVTLNGRHTKMIIVTEYLISAITPFSSPSYAAWIASGTGLNGWDHWKTKNGKTLDEVYRKDK